LFSALYAGYPDASSTRYVARLGRPSKASASHFSKSSKNDLQITRLLLLAQKQKI
jgi:hypothetical protein